MPCLRCLFLAQTAAALSLEEVTDQLDDDAPCSAHGISVAEPSLLSVEEQRAALVATLQRLRQAGSALRRAHSQVQKREREVADLRQTASQQEARLTNLEHLHGAAMQELEQQLRIVQTQAEEIRELSAPPIEVGAGILAVPLIGKLDRERADYVTQHILSTVQKQHVRRVILDLTGLREADEQAARAASHPFGANTHWCAGHTVRHCCSHRAGARRCGSRSSPTQHCRDAAYRAATGLIWDSFNADSSMRDRDVGDGGIFVIDSSPPKAAIESGV